MAKQELLIHPSDIRTMSKDIKQLKKFGSLKLKNDAGVVKLNLDQKKEGVAAAREEESMEKIIGQAVKERQTSEQFIRNAIKTPHIDQPRNQEHEKKVIPISATPKTQLQSSAQAVKAPLKEVANQPKEKSQAVYDNYQEPLGQSKTQPREQKPPVQAKTAAPSQGESRNPYTQEKPTGAASQAKRKSFMEEIEEWTNQNN